MLILIASWPKSGNTWFRAILSNYIAKTEIDLNGMSKLVPIDSAKGLWSEFLGLDIQGITGKEIYAHRSSMYKKLNEKVGDKKRLFLKTHSANIRIANAANFDMASISKVVHIVRNPFDVLPSFANHMGLPIEKAWISMQNKSLALNESEKQYSEFISSWEYHTQSFLTLKPNTEKYLLLRYEDMKLRPVTSLRRVLEFTQIKVDENKLVDALWRAKFENLQAAEKESGFKEAPPGRTFFRSGKIGSFKQEIPAQILDEMTSKYRKISNMLGYKL